MAIRGEKSACGGCASFPLREALQAGGKAQCPLYGDVRGYDYPATVLYTQAPNIIERRGMVKQFLEVQLNQGEK